MICCLFYESLIMASGFRFVLRPAPYCLRCFFSIECHSDLSQQRLRTTHLEGICLIDQSPCNGEWQGREPKTNSGPVLSHCQLNHRNMVYDF